MVDTCSVCGEPIRTREVPTKQKEDGSWETTSVRDEAIAKTSTGELRHPRCKR